MVSCRPRRAVQAAQNGPSGNSSATQQHFSSWHCRLALRPACLRWVRPLELSLAPKRKSTCRSHAISWRHVIRCVEASWRCSLVILCCVCAADVRAVTDQDRPRVRGVLAGHDDRRARQPLAAVSLLRLTACLLLPAFITAAVAAVDACAERLPRACSCCGA